MTALFGELIAVPQFLVNNALSNSDINVIKRKSLWPANEQTGYGASNPTFWAKQEVILLHMYAMLCKNLFELVELGKRLNSDLF